MSSRLLQAPRLEGGPEPVFAGGPTPSPVQASRARSSKRPKLFRSQSSNRTRFTSLAVSSFRINFLQRAFSLLSCCSAHRHHSRVSNVVDGSRQIVWPNTNYCQIQKYTFSQPAHSPVVAVSMAGVTSAAGFPVARTLRVHLVAWHPSSLPNHTAELKKAQFFLNRANFTEELLWPPSRRDNWLVPTGLHWVAHPAPRVTHTAPPLLPLLFCTPCDNLTHILC